ncbi:MAG: Hsp20 family protein [Patescibacteria group bacterium]
MTKIRLLLRELRQANELSQEEVARALSVSRQSIISLERGEYLPSTPVLLAMMDFFGCPVDQLFTGFEFKIRQINTNEEIGEGGEQTMQQTPSNPFNQLDRLHDEMNDMVEKTFGRGDWSRSLGSVAGAMNIHETEKEYEIHFQVPGYIEDELNIEITDNTLTVTGAKKDEDAEKGKSLVRREWAHSEFSRSIRFATPIKDDKVEAKLEHGTLTITAPKVEPVKPKIKKISVKKK